MSGPAVSDATPLISLASVRKLDLIRATVGPIAVPPAVWREVVIQGGGRPGAAEVRDATWIAREALRRPERALALQRSAGLDAGEAEAFQLAEETGAPLVLVDEDDARRYARRAGIDVLGTLGVLVRARRRGLIDDVAALAREMRERGVFFADRDIERAARLAEAPEW